MLLLRRPRYAIPIGLLVLLIALVFMGSSSSVLSTSEIQDLQHMADRDGITLEQATSLYGWHNDFAAMVQDVREAAPDTLAKVKIGEIAFSEGIPSEAQTIIDAFSDDNPNVSVTLIANKGYTESEMQTTLEAIHFTLRKDADVQEVITRFDRDADKIVSEIMLADSAADSTITRLQGVAEGKISSSLSSRLSVEVSKSAYEGSPEDLDLSSTKHRGGESLPHSTDEFCTTGFVVSNGSDTGVTTAGHCPDTLTDDNVNIAIQGSDYEGYYGDVQWHVGSQPTPSEFYAGSNATTEIWVRTPDGVGIPMVDMQLCKNGHTTHKTCDNVMEIDTCHFEHCKTIIMDNRKANYGDSGGPVYSFDTAYGFVMAWTPRNGVLVDAYTRADQLDNAISGLYIVTD